MALETAVKLNLLADGFKKGIGEAGRALEEFGNTAKEIAEKASTAFIGAGSFIGLASHEAIQGENALVRFGAAMKAAGKSADVGRMEAFASALEEETGFADDVIASAGAMGASFQLNQSQVEQLLPRIADLAALTGQDLQSAMGVVGRSIQSGDDSLRRYGVVMTDAQRKTFALASQQDRLQMIMAILNQKAGGVAKTMSETFGGSLTKVKNAVANALEEVGKIVNVPLKDWAAKVAEQAKNLQNWLSQLSPEMKKFVGEIILFGSTGTGVITVISGIAAAFAKLGPKIAELGPSIAKFATKLVPVLLPVLAIAAGIAGIILLVGALKRAWNADLFGMQETLKKWASTVREWWRKMIEILTRAWSDFVKWLSGTWLGKKLGITASEPFDAMLENFDGAADGIKDTAKQMMDDVKETFGEGVDALKPIWDSVKGWLKLPDFVFPTWGAGPKGGGGAGAPNTAGGAGSLAAPSAQAARISEEAKSAGDKIVGAFGDVGQVASSVMKGFANGGGIWGALIALVAEILIRLPTFKKFVEMINKSFASTLEALDPFLEGLMPLVKGITAMLSILTVIALKLLKLDPVFNILKGVVLALGSLLQVLAKGIVWAYNKLIDGVAAIIGIFSDSLAKKMRALKMKSQDWTFSSEDVTPTTRDRSKESWLPKFWDNTKKASEGLDDLDKTVDKVNAALTNIPSGFKVALARFNATAPGGANAAAPGGVTIQFNGITNTDEMVAKINKVISLGAYNRTGSILGGSPFAVPGVV